MERRFSGKWHYGHQGVGEENRPRYREMTGDLDDSVGAILDRLEDDR